MIKMIVGCHAQTHALAYGDDCEMAQKELAELIARLNEDRWSTNRKDSCTHIIKCPTGDTAVVLEKVEVARLVDTETDAKIHKPDVDRRDDFEIARRIKYWQALRAAGLPVSEMDKTA